MDGVWIQPASWMPFDSFDLKITVRGRKVHIRYERRNSAHDSVCNPAHDSVCIPVAAGFSLRDTPVAAGTVAAPFRVRNLRRLKPAATESAATESAVAESVAAGVCNRTFIVNGVEMQGTCDRVMDTVKLWVPWKTLAHGPTEIMIIG